MKLQLTLLLLVAISAIAAAQDLPVTFREDFNDNRGGWPTNNNANGKVGVSNGMYSVERRIPRGSWFLAAPKQWVDFGKDFDLEFRARWLGGVKNNGFGISWGGQDVNNIHNFVISADGKYKLYSSLGGRNSDVLEWQPSASINLNQEWNVVTLKKRGTAVNIALNGGTISSVEAPQVFGTAFGLIVSQSMKVEFDYVELRIEKDTIRLASDYPKGVEREHLGSNVNCEGGDLSPVITADGRRLYIGRYPYKGNIGFPEKEDIYYSDLQKDGTWGMMQNQGRPLNNEGSNFLISITPDGNTALVGNTYYPNGRPRGAGVSVAYMTENGWTVPVPVQIDNYYNTHRFSEMCLDPSGTKLIMAIERRDSKGQKDLYVSHKKANGAFTEPQNITMLSTWGNEMSPFVAADGETMYFASDGRYGYGGVDIWMSRRLDDSWLLWSEPENLGPVVNTPNWDAYFTVDAKGDYAYLSATDPKTNNADIFRVPLTAGVRPNPVVLIRGKVLDANTKKPIAALVEYESLTKDLRMGEARSEPKNGEYAIALPSGDLYGFLASSKGYYAVSDQIDTRQLAEFNEITRDLYLAPIAKDAVIRLNNLFFDSGKSDIRPESKRELDRLATFLLSKGSIQIELSGHTDNVGSDADNKTLSQDRVNAVKEYLVGKGLPGERMTAVGYGEKKPLASNTTEDGRQKNRRVEFKIVSL